MLSEEKTALKIRRYLKQDLKVEVYNEMTSTFSLAEQMEYGSIVVAFNQTQGRGRMDRSFYSEAGGIYMSLCLPSPPKILTLITPAAGVAVCRAIDKVMHIKCGIKWMNDVNYCGKKVCGILTKVFFNDNKIKTVTGIGINYCVNIPYELQNRATTLDKNFDEKTYAMLIAETANSMIELIDKGDIISAYKPLCETIGKTVTYNGKSVLAKDISRDGGLIVEDDGVIKTLTVDELT